MSLHPNWASLASIEIPWKTFVKESCNNSIKSAEKYYNQLRFKGTEAQIAYEEIINDESYVSCTPARKNNYVKSKAISHPNNVSTKSCSTSVKTIQTSDVNATEITANSILKAIEQCDLKFVKKHLNSENVNISDDFGWTPLMSAAYCGQIEIAAFLLKLGANRKARDKSGLTAAQLALKKNYLNIVALLRKKDVVRDDETESVLRSCRVYTANVVSGNIETIDPSADTSTLQKDEIKRRKARPNENLGFYCDICQTNFKETSLEKHVTSTLHIFNTKPKLPKAMYGISKQNKGYQMLLNTGWEEDEGLGPSGEGLKYPIKTILKVDRKGFGLPMEKEARVSHFKPGDINAVNSMMSGEQEMLKYLEQIERKAGEILTDRQEVVALDKRRNEDRVGMRALQKQKSQKSWMAIGPLLFKLPNSTAEDLLMRDQKECDTEINKIRSDLKVKVNELRDLEHTPPVPGLMLQPMSRTEMAAINNAIGQGL